MKCPIKLLGNKAFRKSLEQTGPVSTFARVCTSNHLADLQWIAFFTGAFWVVLGLIILFRIEYLDKPGFKEISIAGLTATTAGILSWIYQTGSNRLGAVDLFACEISALCRVSIVVDFAESTVAGAKLLEGSSASAPEERSKPEEEKRQFTSEENYTPVYDGKLSDLQPLDANVVTYVTEFYTYRKTMMDYLRQIATLSSNSAVRRKTTVQMIYMQFLMYESAHKAIESLIEFEPNRTESLINIFCSELIVYRFLLDEYRAQSPEGSDCRYRRLCLREKYYLTDVSNLYNLTMEHRNDPNPHWDRAKTTASELRSRFEEVFPDHKGLMTNLHA